MLHAGPWAAVLMEATEKPPADRPVTAQECMSTWSDDALSEAVAVEVMGWRRLPNGTWAYGSEDAPLAGVIVAPFATDIALAMEVFEKVTGEPLHEGFINHTDDGWLVGILVGGGPMYDLDSAPTASSDTVPRAICEAALLWARARGV